jgi:tRNA pseudouridine55 synthase
MNGFININKKSGMTSNDVVVKVRGILKNLTGDKKIKTGHMGTLDPLATGVLPIAFGTATKLFNLLLEKRKTYEAGIEFGVTTDTLDGGGKVQNTVECDISYEEINNVLNQFKGKISQIPPQYSAKSVNGQRAYDIARNGGSVELEAKEVTIYDLKLLRKNDKNNYSMLIECSGGTYIRSLMRDIAYSLNTIGYMSYLNRTQSGNFLLNDSVNFEEFNVNPSAYFISLESYFKDYDNYSLNEEEFFKFKNGITLYINDKIDKNKDFVLSYNNEICAIANNSDDKTNIRVRLYDNRL